MQIFAPFEICFQQTFLNKITDLGTNDRKINKAWHMASRSLQYIWENKCMKLPKIEIRYSGTQSWGISLYWSWMNKILQRKCCLMDTNGRIIGNQDLDHRRMIKSKAKDLKDINIGDNRGQWRSWLQIKLPKDILKNKE